MTDDQLERPRELGELFSQSFALYRASLGAFVVIAAAVVVPAQVIVSGVGLQQLTATYDPSPPTAELIAPLLVGYLVTTPLITAICIHVLRATSGGEPARPGAAITAGLEAFAPVFAAVALTALGIAVGLILILPGLYLAVRWYFVPQAVVLDGARGPEALGRSGRLVEGHWWRTFSVVILANLLATLPALVIQAPIAALAKSADREAVLLAGQIVVETISAPFVAIASTLLYFDLRARGGTR